MTKDYYQTLFRPARLWGYHRLTVFSMASTV